MSVSPFLRRGFLLLRDGKVQDLLGELGHLNDGGEALRPFLPHLVRLVVFSRPDTTTSSECIARNTAVLSIITGLEAAQPILSSVSVDVEKLKHDVLSEKQLRAKQATSGGLSQESVLVQSIKGPLEVEFDQADPDRKLRLFMCELLRLISQVESKNGEWFAISHPLFDCSLHSHDMVDLLHLALTELHPMVSCEEVANVLVRLRDGSRLLVQLAAGLPHCYQSILDAVATCTFSNGIEQTQEWQACSSALLSLCQLDPPLAALQTREKCVRSGGPVACMLLLTDELAKSAQDQKLFGVARGSVWLDFITSLLLGEKCAARDLLLQYIQTAQKKKLRTVKAHPTFELLLENLHQELLSLFMASHPQTQLLGVMDGASAAEASAGVSEMVMDEGTSGATGLSGDDGLVHEEVMDIGMPECPPDAADSSSGGAASQSDSLNDGFTEVEELQSGTATASMSGTSIQLSEATEDLFKHINAGVLSLDTSMVSISESPVNLDFGVKGLLQLPESETSRGCQLLRSFCALVGIANLRLSGEQTEPLVQLITARPPLTESGARFVELALCTLLICPSLTGDVENSRCVVDWLRWLLKEQPAFDKALGSHVPYGELLLLVAIHYHGGQLERIVELVRMVLGININLSSNRLIGMKMLFTQDVFTEKVVVEHAMQVGVTPALSAHMTNYLPIHCLLELLQTRSFARHATQLKEWIYRQLLECSAPVHSLMPQLIDEFVRTLILPIQGVQPPSEGVHKGFCDAEILAVFQDSSEPVERKSRTVGHATHEVLTSSGLDLSNRQPVAGTSGDTDMDVGQSHRLQTSAGHGPVVQLLMLYYVLTYHDFLLANLKKIMSIPSISRNANPVALSPFSLVSRLPIKKLLVCARLSPRQFGNLYSHLLRLLITHLPHLCLAQDWLAEESELSASFANASSLASSAAVGQSGSDSPSTVKRKRKASRNFRGWIEPLERRIRMPSAEELSLAYDSITTNPTLCNSCLKRLCCVQDPSSLVPFLDTIVSALPKLLDPGTPRVIQTSTATLWRRLSSVVPRRLWVATVNALRSKSSRSSGSLTPPVVRVAHSTKYTEEDIVCKPTLVLACRREVFRCPVVFDLVCRVLAAYLAARTADITEKSHNSVMLDHRRNPLAANIAVMEHESEELRSAMCSAEDSLAIQLLIEICAPTKEEIESGKAEEDLWELTEIRSIVASALHQMYIDDPSIVKLVHFQGYDERLLPVFVASVPSMFICVDFIPELLTQPQQDKQVFALQLCFHLCSHYPLPRTLTVARSGMSHLSMIMSTRAMSEYTAVFLPVLPSLTRACRTLPALLEDAISLLLRLGRILCGVGRERLSSYLSPPHSPGNAWKTNTMQQATALPSTGQYPQLLQALQTIFDLAR